MLSLEGDDGDEPLTKATRWDRFCDLLVGLAESEIGDKVRPAAHFTQKQVFLLYTFSTRPHWSFCSTRTDRRQPVQRGKSLGILPGRAVELVLKIRQAGMPSWKTSRCIIADREQKDHLELSRRPH
jgi:hypothetical protein